MYLRNLQVRGFRNILDATLALSPGFNYIIGPNGAGKSTTFKLISGDLEPDRGEITRRADLVVAELAQTLPAAMDQTVRQVVRSGLDEVQTLLGSYQLAQFSAVVGAGYAFLPFVLMAGLTIFPLTLVENLVLSSLLLLAQALAGYLSWATLNWPSFAGAFWLLILIAGVASLASMSQLAFMIALVRQAIRDPLTGVFSRGSGEEILRLQWDSAQRKDSALALAFIDLDHFKSINDNYGHEAGDQVLREAARRLVATLRSSDSLLRWGGEEFLLIMPETDMEQAHKAIERIVGEGLGVRPDGLALTASIGLAERRNDQVDDYRDLLELADRRMYLAKTGGRNRLCAAESEKPQHQRALALES